VKENVRLCPWADVVYGCDGPWWKNKRGLPEFAGTKLCHDPAVCATYKDVHHLDIENRRDVILTDVAGRVGDGRNSGFQAINLAIQFGADRILLIGFDAHGGAGVHWYGRNLGRDMRNPRDRSYLIWRNALHKQEPLLKKLGVDVVNASRDSAIVCFPKMTVEQALTRWGIA
jgi:hypothetical protein